MKAEALAVLFLHGVPKCMEQYVAHSGSPLYVFQSLLTLSYSKFQQLLLQPGWGQTRQHIPHPAWDLDLD